MPGAGVMVPEIKPVPVPMLSPAGRPLAEKLRSDRKSTRLNSSHVEISYAVFCLKKKKRKRKGGKDRREQHTTRKTANLRCSVGVAQCETVDEVRDTSRYCECAVSDECTEARRTC